MRLILIVLLSSVSAIEFPDLEDYCNDSYCHILGRSRKYSDKKATKLTEFHIDICDKDVLQLMPNLRTLELENCDLPDFTIKDLYPLPYLTSLQLRSSNLLKLDDEHFSKWPGMQILVLGGNNITRLSDECFKGLPQLWLLSLPGNGIRLLPWGVFDTLPELLHLDLSGNRIENLPENIFSGLPKLEMLLLNGNPLIYISPTSLKPLSNLRLLDLSYCGPLPDLSLPGAHTLILDNSGVQRLDILGSVHKLQARNNHLTEIRLPNKSSVIELDLHNNLLTSNDIPKLLMGMWRLQRLDLSKNLIGMYAAAGSDNSSELFMLPNLMYLNLSENRLSRLHFDSPIPWERLTHLDVSYNRIYAPAYIGINEAFNLQSLHLEGNWISYLLLSSWKPHPRLKELALYDNRFPPEGYKNTTNFFKEMGVNVLEKTQYNHSNNASPSTCKPCIPAAIDFPISNDTKTKCDTVTEAPSTCKPCIPDVNDFPKGNNTNQKCDTDNEANRFSNDTYRKWNLWNVVTLVSLSISLALNAFVIVLLIRSRRRLASALATMDMLSNDFDDQIMLG
ncbi:protein artichoke [Drosophila teissieri]|uniref:protein artichoke n=1 Tax=Drosophila teissieri TaxID=7243 RepID=UPI001CBA111D|nr:protein artichoke [Drosophila teissieri]